jgi:hypothetical protein
LVSALAARPELVLDFQTYEYVRITADVPFGRLPPTATQ